MNNSTEAIPMGRGATAPRSVSKRDGQPGPPATLRGRVVCSIAIDCSDDRRRYRFVASPVRKETEPGTKRSFDREVDDQTAATSVCASPIERASTSRRPTTSPRQFEPRSTRKIRSIVDSVFPSNDPSSIVLLVWRFVSAVGQYAGALLITSVRGRLENLG